MVRFWKKLRKSSLSGTENFLENREPYCVSAISRFSSGIISHIWANYTENNEISALLLYGKRILFPVFQFLPEIKRDFLQNTMPLPLFFPALLKNDSLHVAQGLGEDMNILEASLKKKGLIPVSSYDYVLQNFEYSGEEPQRVFPGSLQDMVIRKADMGDSDALYPLQAAYEQEEVLPEGARFNPVVCRKGLEYLIGGGMVLAAEIKGRLVGKININAQSYCHFQIGGVYVEPEYRNRGIAKAMTAALIREFAPRKNRFSLFVKKTNRSARKVYDSLGFVKTGDYRISYYE
jgi:GNAT superfamily N-acetyltransferase